MTHVKKALAVAITLFFAGTVTAFAQVRQGDQNTAPAPSPAPQSAPADQRPSSPSAAPQSRPQDPDPGRPEGTNISEEDLKEFAAVYSHVQAEGQKAQQEMAAVIEKDGMKLERFNEIQTAKMQNSKPDATEAEMKTFDKITGDLDALQPDIQKRMEAAVKSSGMSVEKFQSIAAAIQSDKDVQARFQKIMGDNGSPG